MSDHDGDFIIACAMRYCMGRSSYAVGLCCDYIRAHWHEINGNMRQTMLRDLTSELKRYEDRGQPMGDKIDDDEWRKLLAYMIDVVPTTPDANGATSHER